MEGPQIRGVGRALPPHHADQETLLAALEEFWAAKHFNVDRLHQFHRSVQVGGRCLALPLEAYRDLDFERSNAAFQRVSLEVGEQAIRRALDAAGLGPTDVHQLVFTTVTGLDTPSLDARLVNRMGLRNDLRRLPSFGLGCVAGAACLSRAADLVIPRPDEVAVVLAVELCSLTLQREDLSVPNLIGSGLFGDGAAAVVVAGPEAKGERRGPRIVATRSVFYPDTEDTMGWEFTSSGFKLVLNAKVPVLARAHLRADVDRFLGDHGLDRRDVKHWVCHPGGPKVLEAIEEALELPRSATQRSWRSLEEFGNLSSASVLFILGDTLAEADAKPGDLGVLMAMGPGFCSELILLRW